MPTLANRINQIRKNRISRIVILKSLANSPCHSEVLRSKAEESQNKLIVYCYFKALSLNLPCHSEPSLEGEESLITES
ncbi:hypothetical protein [Helicobacter sp. MIT 14-3879]|uniref:hypothetical protein n=1 Tax=Helicobacter sp. MIT 14-3879 TaxID=2040649 RepID=UPI000E1F190A|nr:hypothetical protein [Helicobacter sp. MIT 14-3879]RDU60862.1 hypothetical protein CQA44_10110 [Helicobacter sp. MIT 14-3879]